MSNWLEKRIQKREEAASKQYRAATRHTRRAELSEPLPQDNSILPTLLDQWEQKEYGIKAQQYETVHTELQGILPNTKEQGRRLHCTRKMEALSILGGSCASCGETNPNVLEVHHTNNDGSDHRLQLWRSIRGNPNIHKWVIDNPTEASTKVEVLCANCHTLKTYRTSRLHDRAVRLLGGECSSCGLPDIRVLELNHYNGNGKEHRKEVGSTASWVIRVGAAEASRVVSPLCSNCHALWHSTCQDIAK